VVNRLGADDLRAAAPLSYTYFSAGPRFRRGDGNGDGGIDLSDAVGTIFHLYLDGDEPPCLSALDANDSNDLDLSDAIFILNYLFTGGPQPPSPHPECGADPTGEAPGCAGPFGCP